MAKKQYLTTSMTKKEKTLSFLWQHFLLLISLYLMTLGVVLCVKSCLGSSVISSRVRFFAGRPDKLCSGMDDRRIYDCDECGPGTLSDSYPAKEIRPHAAFPAGHRIHFRVAD